MEHLIKILILLILILTLVYFALSFVQEKALGFITEVGETELDGTNSVRYQDMLIYYDTETERNAYGYELLVEKDGGYVVDKGEIVELKEGTYILSGHGESADFLKEIAIGDIVELDSGLVKITRDLYKSSLKIVEIEDEKINEIIRYKKDNLYDIDYDGIETANKRISRAITEFKLSFILSPKDEDKINKKLDNIFDLLDSKYYCTVESRAVELRGLWHRPNRSGIDESNLDGVREFVNHIHELGVNTLYVETFWHGMTTYYSDYLGLAHPQMSKFSYGEYGNDYMLALISECHKVGIEVHAWFETLNAVYSVDKLHSYIDPSWVAYDLDASNGKAFLDPSNPEVKAFLLNIISEMYEKYDFDGISYDYIRYHEAGDFDGYQDSGFSENSINLFTEQYGYTGDNLMSDVVTNEEIRAKWQEFKINSITSLVRDMTALIRRIAPDTVISVSPYGHVEHAKSVYMQDVATWCDMGYVDVILPMIYTDNLDFYNQTVQSFSVILDDVLQVPGIYSLYNGESLRTTEELVNTFSPLTVGNSIFASQNVISNSRSYARDVMAVLSTSSHEGIAISPTDNVDDVFSAWQSQTYDRCERIYQEKMTEQEYSLITDFLDNPYEIKNSKDIINMKKGLECLKIELESFSDDAVKARLTEQIDYICSILSFHIKHSV